MEGEPSLPAVADDFAVTLTPEEMAPAILAADSDADVRLDLAAPPFDAAGQDDVPPPSFVRQAQRRARWNRPWLRFVAWTLLVLLPVLLVLQFLLYQRNPLAAQVPALRPLLVSLCQVAGCSIAAPHNIAMVVVSGSAFNQEAQPGQYRLGLSVRNQSSSIVATPALELTLTDASDQPLVRRIFRPAELGMPAELGPRAEWSGSLPLAVQPLPQPIAGYRMELFYP